MKHMLPLLFLSACATPALNMAAEKPARAEYQSGTSADVQRHNASLPPHLFEGKATGAWQIDARVSPHVANGYVVYMSDTNRVAPGQLNVLLQRSGDHSISLMVNSTGCPPSKSKVELFQGPDWDAASHAERGARVLRAMQSGARSVAQACEADATSLADELAAFASAFQLFDQWEP